MSASSVPDPASPVPDPASPVPDPASPRPDPASPRPDPAAERATRAAQALSAHLRAQLGAWPPHAPLELTTSPARRRPGWDGVIRPTFGVRTPAGAVLSLAPELLERVEKLDTSGGVDAVRDEIGALLGGRLLEAAFRWSEEPAPLEPIGEWRPAHDPVLPDWLRPFGGDALVVLEHGRYVAGVGLKRHDEHGWEIAVGTEPEARGRGLARRLVASAARRLLDQGKVPLYFHALDNEASARVADAAGFPDRGWRLLFVLPDPAN